MLRVLEPEEVENPDGPDLLIFFRYIGDGNRAAPNGADDKLVQRAPHHGCCVAAWVNLVELARGQGQIHARGVLQRIAMACGMGGRLPQRAG